MAPEDFFEFVPEIGMCRGGLAVLECRFLLFFVFGNLVAGPGDQNVQRRAGKTIDLT